MLGLHEYIFWLQNSDYLFWQPDSSGFLTLTANEYHLDKSPSGWEEVAVECIRNDKYFALDRSVSVPLSFVGDGAALLKQIFAQFGHDADCFLTIARRKLTETPLAFSLDYDVIYRAKIDMATYKHTGANVTCSLAEDGLIKFLKANENTPYELKMDAGQFVKMDGVVLRQVARYGITDGLRVFDHRFIMDVPFLDTEGDNAGGIIVDETFEALPDTAAGELAALIASDNYFFSNDTAQTIPVTVSGVAKFKAATINPLVPNGIAGFIKLARDTGTGQAISFPLFSQSLPVFVSDYEFNFSVTINAIPGDKLFFVGNSFVNNTYYIEFYPGSLLNASFPTRRAVSYAYHLPAQYIFEQLINKLTEGNYTAAISQLMAKETIKFTCGDALREVKDIEGNYAAVMRLSFLDFFRFWDYRFNCGLSELNGAVILERKEDLIDLGDIVDLPAPALTPSFYCISKGIFNEFEYGYPDMSNEIGILNGREEFNCKWLRSLGTINNPKKLSRISPIRASCYEQEDLRKRYLQKDTTDNKSDNLVFANHCEDALQPAAGAVPAHYRLNRTMNADVTSGLLEPASVWNLYLRPELMLEANGGFIRSSFYKFDTKVLKFITAERNSRIVFDGIADNRDINIGALLPAYTIPFGANIDVPAPEDIMMNLQINPLQVFRFYLEGEAYLWIPQKISSSSSSKQVQGYELISLSGNHLNKIANYEG